MTIDVKNGAFYITKNGITTNQPKNKKVLNVYFDPSCPFCAYADTLIMKNLDEILTDEYVIRYSPVTFLGKKGLDSYSHIMATSFLTSIVYAPNVAEKYFKAVMDSTQQPIGRQIIDAPEKLLESKKRSRKTTS